MLSDLDAVVAAASGAPTAVQLESNLLALGWAHVGEGDWAVALGSPDGTLAARISPFDPACAYAVALYTEGAGNPHLPTLHAHAELDGGGCLMVLDLLRPARPEELDELDSADDPDWAAANELVERIHRRLVAELPWPGRLDRNPGNVMRDARGRLKIIDPFYLDGEQLYAAVLSDPDLVAARLPPERRRHMFDIPAMRRYDVSDEELGRMQAAMAGADARAS